MTDLGNRDLELALLVMLARRLKMARYCYRRACNATTPQSMLDFMRGQENEAWNALQSAKALVNELESRKAGIETIGRLREEVAKLKKERDAIYRVAMTAGVSAMVIQDEVGAALGGRLDDGHR